MSRRGGTIAALAAATLLAGPVQPARAAAVFVLDGQLVVGDEAAQENRVTIVPEGDGYRVVDDAGVTTNVGCTQVDATSALCSAAGVTGLTASLGGGDDQLTVASALPAYINGGPGADLIAAGDGPDLILGGAGGDTVHAGGGDDLLLENDGEANVLDGGDGKDGIVGGSGPDEILGGPGDDWQLYGYYGDDVVDGGAGDDTLDGGAGPQGLTTDADRLSGGEGTDTVTYSVHLGGVQVALGDGPGDGVIGERDDVAGDVERLIGSQAADVLVGGPGNDAIDGAGGADVIDGGGGDDVLDGGAGDGGADTLRGAAGRDQLNGRAGGDLLDGGADADLLQGGGEDDSLAGGPGADVLDGGDGDDRLDGGEGPDRLTGGAGTDTVRYPASVPVEVTIDDLANDGAVVPTPDGRTRVEEGAASEGDNVDVTNESVDGSRLDDTVSGDGDPNQLEGASGEDYLDGRGGADQLSGGGRSDTIMARDGRRDRVSCGAGVDYVVADRADLIGAAARCEYVDDDSTARPRALRDVAVHPRCAGGRDADLSPPGTRRSVPIKGRVRVPTGSRIDSFDCEVTLTAAVGGGRSASGDLGRGTGTMAVSQRRVAGKLVTRLRSTDCAAQARAAGATAQAARYAQPRYRRRYGRFGIPVELRLDAAVIRKGRGVATWQVDDVCGRSATVRVSSGRLTVVDLGRDRRVVLGPGDAYTARAP